MFQKVFNTIVLICWWQLHICYCWYPFLRLRCWEWPCDTIYHVLYFYYCYYIEHISLFMGFMYFSYHIVLVVHRGEYIYVHLNSHVSSLSHLLVHWSWRDPCCLECIVKVVKFSYVWDIGYQLYVLSCISLI